jgi:hypothetical protein
MPATRAAPSADCLSRKCHRQSLESCLSNDAWRASQAQADGEVLRHGTGRPAKPSDCVVGSIVANEAGVAKPRVELPRTANREPNSAASSLERDFLLLTCLIAGATRLVICIASCSVRAATQGRCIELAQDAQTVCARSDGRIAGVNSRLKRQL